MKHESVIIIVVLLVMSWFAVYGIYACCWGVPGKKAQIIELQADNQELEQAIEDYKVALNYEKLFLIMADPDQIVNFGDLEDYIKSKTDFCLEEVE